MIVKMPIRSCWTNAPSILRASPADAAPAPGSGESCPGGGSSSISLKKPRTDVPRKEGDEPLTDDVELFSSDGAFSSGASRPETLHNPCSNTDSLSILAITPSVQHASNSQSAVPDPSYSTNAAQVLDLEDSFDTS